MNQDNNAPAARRFIFSDEFYDEIEKLDDNNATESSSDINNVIPNPVMDVNNIIQNNNPEPIQETKPEPSPNDFFKNSFQETTTVYDNVGNTISQTVSDGKNTEIIIEEPKETKPIFDYPKDNVPDLGIPRKEDIVIPDVIDNQNTLVDVPTINQNDINLNVQTGIDTQLEKEVVSNKDEYVPEINFFDIAPVDLEKQSVPKYRAARRAINPIKLDDEEKKEEEPNLNDTTNIPVKPVESVQVEENWEPAPAPKPIEITEDISYEEETKEEIVVKSDLLDKLMAKERETGKISILARYGDDFTAHDYITNPAIGREREIKELGLILLTPEKSAILVGKPGIGKTSIVEGLAYQLQRNNVPDALKGYTIISVKTTSLLGSTTNGETRLQTLIDELKELDKIILFVDEVHMLMGATNESSLDFANMFKESLGRGSIKMIGATTSDEYERYVLRDKAFVRRFQRVDVNEPTRDETIQILMGTLPKIEKTTGAKLKYTYFIKTEIMSFITDITTEYKRVYGIGSRYPDICITLLNQAFSEAVFNNRNEVNIFDIRTAIQNSKNIYPDVIRKELVNFDNKFKNIIEEEKNSQ